jgi:hypothetical protein
MTHEELNSLLNARVRQVQDLLTATRKRLRLLSLLQDCLKLLAFSVERRLSVGMTVEVYALHVSSLCQDDVSFRDDHEKIVVAFVLGGTEALNAMTLNGREIINLIYRGFFAVVLLREILQRRLDEIAINDKIIEIAKQRSIEASVEQSALSKLPEEFSAPLFADFDESSLEGDNETALRKLLIDAWNKYDEKAFLSSEGLETIVRWLGFREWPPQLGQDQIARD